MKQITKEQLIQYQMKAIDERKDVLIRWTEHNELIFVIGKCDSNNEFYVTNVDARLEFKVE